MIRLTLITMEFILCNSLEGITFVHRITNEQDYQKMDILQMNTRGSHIVESSVVRHKAGLGHSVEYTFCQTSISDCLWNMLGQREVSMKMADVQWYIQRLGRAPSRIQVSILLSYDSITTLYSRAMPCQWPPVT